MRITAAAREANRTRILEAARRLFEARPFVDVTTRELAAAADVATGTLFNYFPTKEELATELFDVALVTALEGRVARSRARGVAADPPAESLAEDLFETVLVALRAFTPLRDSVGPVLATALGPYTLAVPESAGNRLRVRLLDHVRRAIAARGVPFGDDPISAHLFWTLFLGVLSFWSADDSPEQEDTLVLVDQSMRLYANSLPAGAGAPEVPDAS